MEIDMVKLREQYGLAAEYMAHLSRMSDIEFREYVADKLKENNQTIRDETNERRELAEQLRPKKGYSRFSGYW